MAFPHGLFDPEVPVPTQLDPLDVNVETKRVVLPLGFEEYLPDPGDDGEMEPVSMPATSDEEDRLSEAFVHSGWADTRERVYRAMRESHIGMSACSSFRCCGWGAWVLRSTTQPWRYKVAGSWCKSKWCKVCQRRRAIELAARIRPLINPRATRFITLTLKRNEEPLRAQVMRIMMAFRRLRSRVAWKRSQSGGAAFLEITTGSDGSGWHVHLHVLSVGQYLGKQVLSQEWLAVTGDSFIVDIRWIKSPETAVRYVCKYTGKGYTDAMARDHRTMVTLINHLQGMRMYTLFGDWRNAQHESDDEDIVWRPVAPLGEIIRLARRGVPEAQVILELLQPQFGQKADPRAAPTGPPRESEKSPIDQMTDYLWNGD